MGKLHELLAVEPDLNGTAERIITETINTFSKKEGHFKRQVRTYQPVDDEGLKLPDETSEMVTTVPERLDYTWEKVAKYLDAVAQKEVTNTKASAKIEVDGKPLIDQELPATLLLALEGRLKQLREAYNAIPTLEPGEKWDWDAQTRTYASSPKDTFKTKKVRKNHVKAAATDKHPAQVEVYTEDVVVGTWKTRKWSGALTSAKKSDLLGRIDKLIQSVKQARQRANATEAISVSVADALSKFIHEPL